MDHAAKLAQHLVSLTVSQILFLKTSLCFSEKKEECCFFLSQFIHCSICERRERRLMRTAMWTVSLECNVQVYVNVFETKKKKGKEKKENKKTDYNKEDKH